jgi:pimeloyl-ACP methyl ester carboxylesterase
MLPREGFVTTDDGVRLFVQTVGSGPKTVVVPNGFYLVDDFAPVANGRTMIFYDARNRGRSDPVGDASKLERGIHRDVDDLDAVRRHLGIDAIDVMGHSYMGLMVILYAMKHGAHVNRVVQIGPMEPKPGKEYPPHLTGADATLRACLARLADLQEERGTIDPQEFCRKFWSILRVIYVVNPADAGRIRWERCDLPNELNLMKYWTTVTLPSIQRLNLTPEDIAAVKAPVLTVHGRKDRSAPYGGGREWALALPNARLLTVDEAAHVPWIEAPELVFGSIRTFLDGAWPDGAVQVKSVEPLEP